jgi:hypothetical protein
MNYFSRPAFLYTRKILYLVAVSGMILIDADASLIFIDSSLVGSVSPSKTSQSAFRHRHPNATIPSKTKRTSTQPKFFSQSRNSMVCSPCRHASQNIHRSSFA